MDHIAVAYSAVMPGQNRPTMAHSGKTSLGAPFLFPKFILLLNV